MRSMHFTTIVQTSVLLIGACANQPVGPTVPVMPAPGKSFDVFQTDQVGCKNFASGEVAGGVQSANNRQIGTALVGTLLGAGLGGALAGGQGAALGAGFG